MPRGGLLRRLKQRGQVFPDLRPSTNPCFEKESRDFLYKECETGKKESLEEAFQILDSSGQEALLTHVFNAEHASKAEPVVFFGFRKG